MNTVSNPVRITLDKMVYLFEFGPNNNTSCILRDEGCWLTMFIMENSNLS